MYITTYLYVCTYVQLYQSTICSYCINIILYSKYHSESLKTICMLHLQTMDGDLYDKTKELYLQYAELELVSCYAVTERSVELKNESNKCCVNNFVVLCSCVT